MKASDAFLCAHKLQQQVTHTALCLLWVYHNLIQAGILLGVCACGCAVALIPVYSMWVSFGCESSYLCACSEVRLEKGKKGKTTPFCVNLLRSHVLYRAAQGSQTALPPHYLALSVLCNQINLHDITLYSNQLALKLTCTHKALQIHCSGHLCNQTRLQSLQSVYAVRHLSTLWLHLT